MKSLAKYIAPCVSFLCLIHCVGLSVLTILAPSLFMVEHSEVMELSVIGVNWVFGSLAFYNMNRDGKYYLILISLVAVALGAMLIHKEVILHISIFAMAVLQLVAIFSHRKSKKTECCNHKG